MKTPLTFLALMLVHASVASAQVELFPANNATEVNPDTRLRLVFTGTPPLQNTGKVRVYDAAGDTLVDELDMSIPPGPRNTRTPAPYDKFRYSSVPDTVFTVNMPDDDPSHVYQKNFVGGTGDDSARRFFPILLDGNTATVALHNNKLTYGKTYYVEVDAEVFASPFAGIVGKQAWTFTTKQAAPSAQTSPWVVSADGTGDFSTVQGALDALPDTGTDPRDIYIKNGTYDEIVVLRDKQRVTLHGEDREKVVVRYANNGVFNRVGRYEFMVTGSSDVNLVNLVNFTIQSVGSDENPAQAEALFVRGDKYQVHNVTMLGSGDALQIQTDTRLFVSRSSIRGYGDNLLSYGAAFFKRCDMISTYGPHGWPRNPQTNHGDVFVESTFSLEGEGTSGDGHCTLARSPASSATSGVTFPYAEFVLINCKLQGIAPEGWGAAGPDYSNVHFWEYNSVNLSDGKPVDVSQRVSYSRQLTMENDAETIANYNDPSYVLAGWTPELAPIVTTQLPAAVEVPVGGSVEIAVDAAAEPEATYQWHKDGQPLAGETSAVLKLPAASAGEYVVSIANSLGTTMARTNVIVGAAGSAGAAGTTATTGTGAAGNAANGGTTAAAGAAAGAGAQSTGGAAAQVPPPPAGGTPAAASAEPAPGGTQETTDAVRTAGGCNVAPSGDAANACAWLIFGLLVQLRRRRTAYRSR